MPRLDKAERAEDINRLRNKGLSIQAIGEELRIPKSTVAYHVKNVPGTADATKFEQTLQKKLETQIERFLKEIAARDIKEVSTDKLVGMLQTLENLRKSTVPRGEIGGGAYEGKLGSIVGKAISKYFQGEDNERPLIESENVQAGARGSQREENTYEARINES